MVKQIFANANHQIKNLFKNTYIFICDQYLVLFFIITTGIKLALFNAYIIKVGWPLNQYFYGLFFGFLTAAIIYSPLYFIKKQKKNSAIVMAFFISCLLLIDTVYFSYFSTLPTIGLLGSLGQVGDVGPAIGSLMNWWLLLYFIDIVFIMIFSKKIKLYFQSSKEKHGLEEIGRIASWITVSVTILLLIVAFYCVGFQRLDQFIDSSYDTSSTAQYYGVLGAHIVDTARFIEEETTHLSDQQKDTVIDWVKNNKPTQANDQLTGTAKGKNVIMIQIESLGGFVMNQQINGNEITPNLNKLATTSQFFPNDRFEIGAGHTSDTDFVANSSYFPILDASAFVRFGKDDFSSLPKTLINDGYSAYAYHGYNRNFWNRNVAFNSLGYQKFYAADNYPKGATINMGLNDGDFLSKTAEFIKDQPKPSLSYTITLSSHTPFNITDQTKGLNINTDDYPYLVGGYLQDINYTDRMLGDFFTKLKLEGLYDDSLIIVYGDHTPVLPAFDAGTIKYDPNSVQEKEVPLIIKLPNETQGETHPNTGTHLDIMPTILDLIGIKTNQLMFGQSLFDNSKNNLKVCTDQVVAFSDNSNCADTLADEKNISEQIIRYNLFNILPK